MTREIDGQPYWHHYLEVGGELLPCESVFVFPNGMVAVMGYDGQQIAGLQGRFDEVRDCVWAAADEETKFNGWPGIPDGTRGKS